MVAPVIFRVSVPEGKPGKAKPPRSEAIRRLVELGLKAKK
jgi:hypothetical protein